jgi:hypothetical protein
MNKSIDGFDFDKWFDSLGNYITRDVRIVLDKHKVPLSLRNRPKFILSAMLCHQWKDVIHFIQCGANLDHFYAGGKLSIASPRYSLFPNGMNLLTIAVMHRFQDLVPILLPRTHFDTYKAFDYVVNEMSLTEIKMFIKYGHRLEKVTLRHNISKRMLVYQDAFLRVRKNVIVLLAFKKRWVIQLDRFLVRELALATIQAI